MQSVTHENNLLEAALRMQSKEATYVPPTGTAKPNRVTVVINDDSGVATISATLEVERVFSGTGAVSYTAKEYVIDPPSGS